jgi:hypothetical protein
MVVPVGPRYQGIRTKVPPPSRPVLFSWASRAASSAVLDAQDGPLVVNATGQAGIVRLLGIPAGRTGSDRREGQLLVGATLVPSGSGDFSFWMGHAMLLRLCHVKSPGNRFLGLPGKPMQNHLHFFRPFGLINIPA